jgi:hypothetical protein
MYQQFSPSMPRFSKWTLSLTVFRIRKGIRSQDMWQLLPFLCINGYTNAAQCYITSTLHVLLKLSNLILFLANYKINVSIIFPFLFLFRMNASHVIPVLRSVNSPIMVIIPCKRNTSKFLLFHSKRILSWIGSFWNVHIQTSSCFLTLFPSERVQAVSSCFTINTNTSALFHISFKTATQIWLRFFWRSGPATCFLYMPTTYSVSCYRRTWHIQAFYFSF